MKDMKNDLWDVDKSLFATMKGNFVSAGVVSESEKHAGGMHLCYSQGLQMRANANMKC
jgi:hypothetical protein